MSVTFWQLVLAMVLAFAIVKVLTVSVPVWSWLALLGDGASLTSVDRRPTGDAVAIQTGDKYRPSTRNNR